MRKLENKKLIQERKKLIYDLGLYALMYGGKFFWSMPKDQNQNRNINENSKRSYG